MVINNNLQSMNTHRQMGINATNLANSTEKLSSGQRINRAADDAVGLTISEKMRSQIRGLDQASTNAQDGVSLIQTAEGALDETHNILQRMRELSVQSANDTNTDDDRAVIQKEMDALAQEITRISTDTEFNTQKLLDATDKEITLQVGANASQTITITLGKMDATTLGVGTGTGADTASIDIKTQANANTAIGLIDTAIKTVSTQRADLGAVQNRLEHTINNLNNASENTSAAESRIRDVDMAKEMMNFTKSNVLNQAAQAMMAQANQLPSQVLQLLR